MTHFPSFPVRLVALVALAALPYAFCPAQPVSAETPVSAKSASARPDTVSIDFPGGPLSKLMASLGPDQGRPFSIIQPGGQDPVIPSFSVYDQKVESVIVALGMILEPQGYKLNFAGQNLAVLVSPVNDRHRITIDFPGGPLSQLTAMLATTKGPSLSILRGAGDLDPVLPAFSVRDQYADAVIAALGGILKTRGYFLQSLSSNLAMLTRENLDPWSGLVVFPLATKLNHESVEAISGAIQAACGLANFDPKVAEVRIKYHPGTKLLFVAGSTRQLDIARQVIANLPDDPALNPPAAPPAHQ